jgi:hypothetical protein
VTVEIPVEMCPDCGEQLYAETARTHMVEDAMCVDLVRVAHECPAVVRLGPLT